MVITETENSSTFDLTKLSTLKFEWKLEKYASALTSALCSETIVLPNGLKLFLELRPNIYVEYDDYYIAPFYRFECTDQAGQKVSISIKLMKGDQILSNYSGVFETPNKAFMVTSPCPHFIDQSSFQSYLVNGDLLLSIEIKAETKYASEDFCENIMKQKNKVMKDLNAFIGERSTSDFTYRVDDQEFPVHKMMLSARSPVFFKMFTTDFKTSKEGVMSDISKDAFEDFLHFIYTGDVKDLKQHAMELLKVADKYGVDDLKLVCELHLLTHMTEEAAVELFTCAHKFRCSGDLKKASFDFIKNSFAKLNIILPEEFMEAPTAVSKALMMKQNLEDGVKVEVAQAEKINSNMKLNENKEN